MSVKIIATRRSGTLILHVPKGRVNRGSGRTRTVEDLFQKGYGALCGSGGDDPEVLSAGELSTYYSIAQKILALFIWGILRMIPRYCLGER